MTENRYRVIENDDLPQGSLDWLLFKRGKLSSSMMASIMGEDPWRTKLQLFEEIIYETQKEQTPAMKRGIELEPVARQWLNQKTGMNFRPVTIQSNQYPEFVSSLDAYYVDEQGKVYAAEIKAPGKKTHQMAKEGEIPEHYKIQMTDQADMLGIDEILYVSFDDQHAEGEEPGVIIPFTIDKHYCVDLFAAKLSFLASIFSMKAPEPDERDWITDIDLSKASLASLYEHYDVVEKDAVERKKKIREELLATVTHPRTKVGNLKIQKINVKGRINYEKLVLEHNLADVAETYRGQTTITWKINVS